MSVIIPPLSDAFFTQPNRSAYARGGADPSMVLRPASEVMSESWRKCFQNLCNEAEEAPNFQAGTHAQRIALDISDEAAGFIFYEADRTLAYVVTPSQTWIYLFGVMSAAVASAPTDLGTADEGVLFNATEVNHLVRWSGTVWTFAPGDNGSGPLVVFGAGLAPQGVGWQLCDGSLTTYLVVGATLTLTNFTTPVAASTYFRR